MCESQVCAPIHRRNVDVLDLYCQSDFGEYTVAYRYFLSQLKPRLSRCLRFFSHQDEDQTNEAEYRFGQTCQTRVQDLAWYARGNETFA